MGADFVIDSNQPPNQKVLAIIDSLGGADGRFRRISVNGCFSKKWGCKLVGVRGIEGNYPFYGELETSPEAAAQEYQDAGGCFSRCHLNVTIWIEGRGFLKLGNSVFPIMATLISAPGTSGIGASIAPPVIIPYEAVEATGLIQVGSRVGYDYYFVAEPEQDLVELDKQVDPQLDVENADLDTHISTAEQLGRSYDNFGKF